MELNFWQYWFGWSRAARRNTCYCGSVFPPTEAAGYRAALRDTPYPLLMHRQRLDLSKDSSSVKSCKLDPPNLISHYLIAVAVGGWDWGSSLTRLFRQQTLWEIKPPMKSLLSVSKGESLIHTKSRPNQMRECGHPWQRLCDLDQLGLFHTTGERSFF